MQPRSIGVKSDLMTIDFDLVEGMRLSEKLQRGLNIYNLLDVVLYFVCSGDPFFAIVPPLYYFHFILFFSLVVASCWISIDLSPLLDRTTNHACEESICPFGCLYKNCRGCSSKNYFRRNCYNCVASGHILADVGRMVRLQKDSCKTRISG